MRDTAKSICATCPVIDNCRNAVFAYESQARYGRYGIWAGLTDDERTSLARKQRRTT